MNKWIALGLTVVILAVDWAALHDILEGEEDLSLEYAILVLSVVVLGTIWTAVGRRGRTRRVGG